MNKDEQISEDKLLERGPALMRLLFDEKGTLPVEKAVLDGLNAAGYETAPAVWEADDHSIKLFYLPQYKVDFEDAKGVPYQLMMADFRPVEIPHGDDMARSQFWRTPNGAELLDSCKWQVVIGDMMSFSHPPQIRSQILSDYLKIALELFPNCKGVFFESSQNVLTAETLRNYPLEGSNLFIFGAVNARLFKIGETEESVVDTLGFHILGIPDVQFHFRDLEVNAVVNHVYNIGMYQFDNDVPIKSGETVDGFDENGKIDVSIQWKCQYEESMIPPKRMVLDIEAGNYAAGDRK